MTLDHDKGYCTITKLEPKYEDFSFRVFGGCVCFLFVRFFLPMKFCLLYVFNPRELCLIVFFYIFDLSVEVCLFYVFEPREL